MAIFAYIYESRAGQMSKYMGNYYHQMSDEALRRLRSKKVVHLQKLSNYGSWYHTKDRAALKEQIKWIDAVLASRAAQPILL